MFNDSGFIGLNSTSFASSMRPQWSDLVDSKSRLSANQVISTINSNGAYIDRIVRVGDMVDAYRNLNKPEYFSCKQLQGKDKGKVACYAKVIILGDVSFKVSESSRQRVLSSTRNVHAFCSGSFLDCFDGVFTPDDSFTRVTYHPRKNDFFYVRATGETIKRNTTARLAVLYGSDVYISNQ